MGTQGCQHKHGLGALSFVNVRFIANNKNLIHKSQARSHMPPGYEHSAGSMECSTRGGDSLVLLDAVQVVEDEALLGDGVAEACVGHLVADEAVNPLAASTGHDTHTKQSGDNGHKHDEGKPMLGVGVELCGPHRHNVSGWDEG